MSAVQLQIGPATAIWSEEIPLRWTMTEAVPIGREGKALRTETRTLNFELASLATGYRLEFLLELKQMLIERRSRVVLRTIQSEFMSLHSILTAVMMGVSKVGTERAIPLPQFQRIDRDFLTALWGLSEQLPSSYLKKFKALFNRERANPTLFEPDLIEADFSAANAASGYIGATGRLRQGVLASALSRSMLVQILNITQEAYEDGSLRLDVYAFSRLIMSKALRPESIRLLRCKDLIVNTQEGKMAYYLRVSLPKARTAVRPEATIPLHIEVGRVLDQQRKAVSQRLAYLMDDRNASLVPGEQPFTIGDLPLFPAGAKRRLTQKAKDRMGFMKSFQNVFGNYISPLKKLTRVKLNQTVLRHTMGTQLAIAGCSAATIAAVLMHATESTAWIYVDLLFEGVIDELSDSMEPAFAEHFPVFKTFMSSQDPISSERRIESETLDSEIRMTGGCGRESICSFAPIVCYECPRFIPCYDADHSINLSVVEREMRWAENGGLARKTEAQKYRHIANRIRVVMTICETKRDEVRAAKKIAEEVESA